MKLRGGIEVVWVSNAGRCQRSCGALDGDEGAGHTFTDEDIGVLGRWRGIGRMRAKGMISGS